MSTTYSLTSNSFEGEVLFHFNEARLLEKFDFTAATLTEKQQTFILRNLPRELAELHKLAESSSNLSLQELTTEVSFEQFWNRYNEKIRSSKKKAARVWDRLSKIDQVKAFNYINKYEINLLPGTAKKYAETYLGAELWNN